MGPLGSKLTEDIISPNIQSANNAQQTVAVVTKADEANNVCTVRYINQDGDKAEIDRAVVDLRNKDWFPQKGDAVLIRVSGSKTALIEQKYTENYNKDVRGKQQLKNDIMPDDNSTCCGQIF